MINDQLATAEEDPNVNNNQQISVEDDQPGSSIVHLHKRTRKVLTRKRKRDPSTWKCNVRKTLRQSGKEYINSRGNLQQARSVKTKKDCSTCKFKCSANFSENDRVQIFKEFGNMNDNEKLHFYGKTTTQEDTKRPLAGRTSHRKKSNTYSLPLNYQNVRVCQVFYLTTLDINHKRVQAYHQKKHQMCGEHPFICSGVKVRIMLFQMKSKMVFVRT